MKKALYLLFAIAWQAWGQAPISVSQPVTGGGTISGDLLFSPDNTYNIGAVGATRPGALTGSSVANLCLGPGDFLSVNTDANTAGQTAWVNFLVL
jgi:hypothetical protein